jgi:hypothetical protein
MKYLKIFEDFEEDEFDYDYVDAQEEDYLYIKTSQIPNSGKGLFTSIDFEKNEIISQFKGKILSERESQRRADRNEDGYFMELPSGEILDCKNTKCFAKYANDAEGTKTNFKNNSYIGLDDEDNVVIVASKKIKAGDEIFTSYGKEYWKNYLSKNKI